MTVGRTDAEALERACRFIAEATHDCPARRRQFLETVLIPRCADCDRSDYATDAEKVPCWVDYFKRGGDGE